MRRSTIPLRFFTDPGDGGGSGDGGTTPPAGDPGAPSPTPGAPADPPTPPVVPPTPSVVPPPQPPAEPDRVDKLPQWSQKLIEDLRTEAGNARTQAKAAAAEEATKATKVAIAGQFGVNPDKLDDFAASYGDDQRELAIWRAAPQDVNVSKVLDSHSFRTKLKTLADATDDKAVRALVDAHVADHPECKVSTQGRAPGASGADHGRTGEPPKPKIPSSLADALNAQDVGQGQ